MTVPRATYRLQFRKGFGFTEAAALAPYLSAIGISHVYSSPIFKARPGSTHGYDIIDHDALNPELGTEDDYSEMIAAFRGAGLGCVQDFVPNHMGVGGADNPPWLDVLEWGPLSNYAPWFDIDWAAGDGPRGEKLLAPLLGAQYGSELKSGNLALAYDAEEGSFAIWAYGQHKLPICPLSYHRVLGHRCEALDRLSDLFLDLPHWRPQIAERARSLKGDLAQLLREDRRARSEVEASVAALNADWRSLDVLIGEQFWRVASHRVASDEVNYRRFFDVNDLAGLRIEMAPVFQHTHRRLLQMIERREIDGVRLDHIDGLFDPKKYLDDFRSAVGHTIYVIVEKILAPHEHLRESWPISGTTGYDSLNVILGALVNPSGEESLTETYRSFAGPSGSVEEVERACKIRIMENEMASELNALSRAAARLAAQSPMTADLTRGILHRALKQVVASFPVYRTYIDLDGSTDGADRRDLEWALAIARRSQPDIHPSAFDFVHDLFLPDGVEATPRESSRTAGLRLAMKVQQYTGPVMAKGVEDTAFYRYNRLIALNEVGGAPDRFGISPTAFHKANAYAAEKWPHQMVATSTHDTKRGEDARARLAVLSELPDEWRRMVFSWSKILHARKGDVEGEAPPDRNDEYMFYQMLVGSWPSELLRAPDPAGLKAYAARIQAALQKSLREGKHRSNWASPNAAYEDAMRDFAAKALDPQGSGFLGSFLPFAERIATLGVQNSLVQLAMKMTLPGAPDIYQGSESWNLNMIDPDNRRPIDYRKLKDMAVELAPRLASVKERAALFRDLLGSWQDGRIKMAVTLLLLGLRRSRGSFFADAGYEPIPIRGDNSDWAIGYLRAGSNRRVAVLVGRFPGLREANFGWRASPLLPRGSWTDLVFGRKIPPKGEMSLCELLDPLPFAVLESAS